MIWYACYGSNMDENRFMKYIQGGELIVNGKTKKYRPCSADTSPPTQSEPYVLDRRFYFAKESGTWNKHGVGFISNRRNKRSRTYSKLYLISEAQFSHIFAQENGRQTVEIEYDRLSDSGYLDFEFNFYNRIILLEENHEGFPILSFTNRNNLSTNEPLLEYVKLISNGLKLTHNLTSKEAFEYIVRKGTGAKRKDLKGLLDDV